MAVNKCLTVQAKVNATLAATLLGSIRLLRLPAHLPRTSSIDTPITPRNHLETCTAQRTSNT